MTSKTQIAVLVAALFLGAQAGIAALEQDPSIVSVESAALAPEQQAEATEPAATEAPEAAAAATAAATTAVQQPEAVSQRPALARESNVFPRSPEGTDMLPALAAYLEQRDAVLSKLVARGDVFPRSPEGTDMLPALAAYLERREATLVARAQAQQPESAAPTAEGRQLAAPIALGLQQSTAGASN